MKFRRQMYLKRRTPRAKILATAVSAAAATLLADLRPALASDLGTVSQRVTSQLLSSLPSVSSVQTDMNTLQSNGSWSDVNYNDSSATNWAPMTHLDRLENMTQLYVSPGNSLYQNATLGADISNAYNYWITKNPQSSNWWYNDIGSLQELGDAMILYGSNLTTTQLNNGQTFLNRAAAAIPTYGGGQNTIDLAIVGMDEGIIYNSSSTMSTAFSEIGGTIAVTPGIGIQYDNSFQEHGPQLYIGGYGQLYDTDVLNTASLAAGTSFAITTAQEQLIVNQLLDGTQWFVYGQALDLTSSGRGDSRAGISTSGTSYESAINSALSLGTYDQAGLQAFLARQQNAVSTGVASSTVDPLSGNRDFYDSDIMVQQRPTFYESVKISSVRTSQVETGNGEGLTNLYMSDGVNQIMVTGKEYANIEPVWNWRMLPGTTVEQDTRSLTPPTAWGMTGTSVYAGGVSDGTYGAEGFSYNRYDVAAQKSWFFFDNEEAALGAAITSHNTSYPVYTTINQCLLTSTVYYETTASSTIQTLTSGSVTPANLKWVYQGGVGYFFATPVSNATILAQTQTGSWYEINTSQSASNVSENVFTLYLNHGTAVANGSYSYIVVPGIAESGMDAYLVSDPIQILANTATVQAIHQSTLNITQAAFYNASSFTLAAGQTIAANGSSTVMVEQATNSIKLYASSPENAQMPLAVTLTGFALSGSGTWFDQMGTAIATFNLPGGSLAGSSVGSTLASDGNATPTVSLSSIDQLTNNLYTVTGPVALAANTTFQTDSFSTIGFSNTVTGPFSVTKTGAGALNLSGTIAYAGGTLVSSGTVNVTGVQLASAGGWSIDPTNTNAATVNFSAGCSVVVGSGQSVRIGNASATGLAAETVNVSGTVTDNGTLYDGRLGYLTVNGGGIWNQTGTMSLNGAGGYGSTLTVNSGGVFAYAGSAAIALNGGSSGGVATLAVAGGTFITNQPFMQTSGSVGNGTIVLSNGGVLELSANLPELIGVASTQPLQIGGGGGSINTGVYSTTINVPISNYNTQAGSFTKLGQGVLTLSAANTYTGTTIVSDGTLLLTGSLNGSAGTPLSFGGTGTFAFNESAGTAQGMGALSFGGGDGVVQSLYGGSGNTSLTFASLARSNGATGNFVITGGTDGTTNRIIVTGQSSGFINQGTFFNGSSYAWMNSSGGYVRAMVYGADSGAATSGGATSLASATHQQFTGPITAQATATFTTLNDSGNNNFNLAGGATVTVNGILKSGNVAGSANISGGTAIQAATNTDLVIRTDGPNDSLTINTNIVANGDSSLTKSGSGILTLAGANTYTGGLFVDGGTLRISTTANFGNAASTLTFDSGAVEVTANAGSTTRLVNIGPSNGTFLVDSGGLLGITNTISGSGTLTKSGPGGLNLSGANNYSGGTVLAAGTLSLGSSSTSTTGPVGTGPLTLDGGTLTNTALITVSNPLFVSAASTTNVIASSSGNITLTGAITGSGTLQNNASVSNSLVMQGDISQFGGTFNYVDTTGLNNFTFNGTGNAVNGSAAHFVLSGATSSSRALDINTNGTFQMGDLSGSGGLISTNGTYKATLQVGSLNDNPAPFAGSISNGNGTLSLTKVGSGTLTLSGASSYTGATDVGAGTLTIADTGSLTGTGSISVAAGATLNDAGLITSSPAVIVNGTVTIGPSPATCILAMNFSSLSLGTTTAPGQVTITSATDHGNRIALITNALTFPGTTNAWVGQLDLGFNDLVVHAGNLANISNQIAEGYNQGAWNGTAGIISTAAAADTTHLTALGVILNNNTYGTASGSLGTFDTINPGTNDVLVKYTWYGDTNLDGQVDGSDYSRIDIGFMNNDTGWSNGDFNYDGVVNGSDYTLIDNAFNMQGSVLSEQIASPTAQPSGASSQVPEPAALSLLAMTSMAVLGRRRR